MSKLIPSHEHAFALNLHRPFPVQARTVLVFTRPHGSPQALNPQKPAIESLSGSSARWEQPEKRNPRHVPG